MNESFQLAGYEMLGKLGQGGMSMVWKARQLSLDRLVAIKTLAAEYLPDAVARERFQQEARAAARLSHPGIVQVFDAGVAGDVPYIVMEFVDGQSLGDVLEKEGKLPEEKALRMAQAVAEALGYAWQKDCIIHCDIKPDNLLISRNGEVKITDLGLARFIGLHRRAAPGGDTIVGTPNYTAPEQAEGLPDLDCRADIYSLGATLYHMVTGELPFANSTGSSAMERHINEFLADPIDVEPSLSSNVAWLIEKMMVKDRAFRPMFWNAVQEDIVAVLAGGPPGDPLPEAGKSTVLRSERRGEAVRAAGAKGTKPGIGKTLPRKRIVTLSGAAATASSPPAKQPPSELGRALIQLFSLLGVAFLLYGFFFVFLAARNEEPGAEAPTAESVATTASGAAVPDGMQLSGNDGEPAEDVATMPVAPVSAVAPPAAPASRPVIYRGADTELDEPPPVGEAKAGLSSQKAVADATRLALAPEWANKPVASNPAWQELRDLLLPYSRTTDTQSGETGELPIIGQIFYRMPVEDAARALNAKLDEERPVHAPGFPQNSFDYYVLRGDFGAGFDIAILVADGDGRVAALQLSRESPAPAALNPSLFRDDWQMLDFVQVKGTTAATRRVGHRVVARNNVVAVESEMVDSELSGPNRAIARAILYLPQPMVNLILARLENAP